VLNYLDPILRELRIRTYNRKYQAAQVCKTNSEQMLLRNIHNSRYFFTGVLGQYMVKYGVNYSKFMNTIDPEIALEIIENLEYTYSKRGKTINAQPHLSCAERRLEIAIGRLILVCNSN
jgi:hypothetical protein